jgi:hypothetical protein
MDTQPMSDDENSDPGPVLHFKQIAVGVHGGGLGPSAIFLYGLDSDGAVYEYQPVDKFWEPLSMQGPPWPVAP